MNTNRVIEVPEAVVEMDRAIKCLALELPEAVWNDVNERWLAVRDLHTPED